MSASLVKVCRGGLSAFQQHGVTCHTWAAHAGWGNNELQWYTSAPANAAVANGTLRLTALRNDSGHAFTSARLRTAGLRDFVPAGPLELLRFEARLQLPLGAPGRCCACGRARCN